MQFFDTRKTQSETASKMKKTFTNSPKYTFVISPINNWYSHKPSSVRSTFTMKNMNPLAPSFWPPTKVLTHPGSKQNYQHVANTGDQEKGDTNMAETVKIKDYVKCINSVFHALWSSLPHPGMSLSLPLCFLGRFTPEIAQERTSRFSAVQFEPISFQWAKIGLQKK